MKGKILVVDDDAHLRESLQDNLELDGYQITTAASGQEALKCVVTGFYDVILMDFNLTDSTGIDVIREIRKINTESQILMMTAHASLDTAIKAIQESVYDFLIKPVDVGYLKRAIDKALEKLRLQQENQRLINELKKANEQLLNLSNMKSKFMSMASHDLSNSLMTLQVSFELLASTLTPNEEQKKRITYISSGIGQISRLIEDLVDWAAIEKGKLRLEKKDFAIAGLVDDVAGSFQSKAAQRQLTLRSSVEPRTMEVFADRKRVGQVLTNLLENALRHTSPGGTITIHAGPQKGQSGPRSGPAAALSQAGGGAKSGTGSDGGYVMIAVQDTGEGIAPADLLRIFESFYQAQHSNSHAQLGRLGLGLSIAREIVTGHGGKIWVESAGPGKGATFFFSLPGID